MIKSISRFFTAIVHRFLPDPLVFAMILTFIVFFAGIAITPTTPMDMVNLWGKGFWNLLAFSMQMALVLVTGHALASSPFLRKVLKNTASIAKTPAQGVMLVAFMGAVASAINWGFGLVVGALFAKEIARRIPKSDYRLLIACAYIGFMTWHGGLSGSCPLVAATPGNPMEKLVGLIPLSQTLFTGYNIFITVALIIVLPLLCKFMMPKEDEVVSVDPALLAEEASTAKVLGPNATFAEKIEESRILAMLIGILGLIYLGTVFAKKGFNMDLNTVNLLFFMLGIMLHGTPMSYMRAVLAAARGTAGIMVQFPFYAGIQLMMEQSGLGGIVTNWFINVATKDTFPIWAFFSSALINFAVPSGGGHWVIQGPFVLPAATALGSDAGKACMAIAYGEEWMNMAQPFWALPALAIAGLGVRDIMGYCVTALIFTLPIFLIGLYFL